eukprot:TRINITY_DN80_c0_g1_i2.p1 TRINITY_DN80_c0_g1~~TRINITY_DN80_c0_g1_i2.p1  ORF type:complete len:208 (-),score=98.87 TRINITY_DN80_c0_g1_i2:742-1365(-)
MTPLPNLITLICGDESLLIAKLQEAMHLVQTMVERIVTNTNIQQQPPQNPLPQQQPPQNPLPQQQLPQRMSPLPSHFGMEQSQQPSQKAEHQEEIDEDAAYHDEVVGNSIGKDTITSPTPESPGVMENHTHFQQQPPQQQQHPSSHYHHQHHQHQHQHPHFPQTMPGPRFAHPVGHHHRHYQPNYPQQQQQRPIPQNQYRQWDSVEL